MDPRKRRSRDRLFAAALDLASENAISTLTVTQVANAAGVHRSTFYEHADSPQGLVEAALTSELDRLRDELMRDEGDPAAALTRVVTGVLEHVLRHREVYTRELEDGGGTLHAMLSRHFRGTTEVLLRDGRIEIPIFVDGAPAGDVADAAARFLADGTVGVIHGWLRRTDPRIESFLPVYLALLPAWWPHPPKA